MTLMLDNFSKFGTLKDPYDIRQMLETLKIKDWRKIPPFAYYLEPLDKLIKDVREELLKMHGLGLLRCKYILENNEVLQEKVIKMVKHDMTVQWLVGDALKQDQFKFMYQIGDIIFKTALKGDFIDPDKSKPRRPLKIVLPKLLAFKTMLTMRDITMAKAAD